MSRARVPEPAARRSSPPARAAPAARRASTERQEGRELERVALRRMPAGSGALRVGAADDPAEREADRVAHRALRGAEPAAGDGPRAVAPPGVVRRQEVDPREIAEEGMRRAEELKETVAEKLRALREKAGRAAEAAKELVGGVGEEVSEGAERWWTAGTGLITRMDFDGFQLKVSGATPYTTAAVSGLRASNPKAGGVSWTGPEHQEVANKGPIPEGTYYVEPTEVETSRTHGFDPRFWGLFRTRLHESWTTAITREATSERDGGFFLHQDGGNDGTAGCIGISSAEGNRTVHGFVLTSGAPIPVYVKYLPPEKVAPGTPPAPATGAAVQRLSLDVASNSDPAEEEADRVAARALGTSGPSLRRCACGGTAGRDGECAECRARRLRRAPTERGAGEGHAAPPVVHEVLASPGRRLDAASRAFFEPRLGLDLGAVRVHDDARAARSAEAVDALAYTVGSDIAFAAGRHEPHTSAGRALLAHELAHVAQQDPTRAALHRFQVQSCSDADRSAIVDPADARAREMVAKAIRVLSSKASPADLPPEVQMALRPNFQTLTPDVAAILGVYQAIEKVFTGDDYLYVCTTEPLGDTDHAEASMQASTIWFVEWPVWNRRIVLAMPRLATRDLDCVAETLVHEMVHYAVNAHSDVYCNEPCEPTNCPPSLSEADAVTNPDSVAGFARRLWSLGV